MCTIDTVKRFVTMRELMLKRDASRVLLNFSVLFKVRLELKLNVGTSRGKISMGRR